MSFRPQFDFLLPQDLIARHPSEKRGQSKMLYYHCMQKKMMDLCIDQIDDFFSPGDIFIVNSSKVLNARFKWEYKHKTEEIVFLKCIESTQNDSQWEAIVSGKKTKLHTWYAQGHFEFLIKEKKPDGLYRVEVSLSQDKLRQCMHDKGLLPIPPYIRKMRKHYQENEDHPNDSINYQTAYAESEGAVAAPTAGLHFTDEILNKLNSHGVSIHKVCLDVGWGTFQALSEEHWKSNKLHEEQVFVPSSTAQAIHQAMQEKKQILAVGTTSLRTLEWWYQEGMSLDDCAGVCDLFIHYPWQSPVATSLLTNFHFPQTSLLHLVSAFINDDSQKKLMDLYQHAIKGHYRFYSYGDCMFIQK